MINTEISADRNFTRELYTCQYLDNLVKEFVEQGKRFTNYTAFDGVTPPSETIDDHNPETLTAPFTFIG